MDGDEETDVQRCCAWLARCQVLPDDAIDELADVQNLVYALRDGVLLCRVANKLKDGAIEAKNFSQRPQTSQFLYLKNIRVFLQTCKKVFGMRDADLFEATDLIEARNFSKVIHTLSVLSKTKEAKKSNIRPFVAERDEIYEISSIDDVEADRIYKNVDDSFDDDYEDVYGVLVEETVKEPSSIQTLSKRDLNINELIETEKKYVDVLRLIVEKFMQPLRSNMSTKDFQCAFLHIEDLYRVHRDFYADLLAAQQPHSSSSQSIAGCFIKHKLKFVIYGNFCSNLIRAQELINRLMKDDQKFCRTVSDLNTEANNNRFKLVELLTVPMQRVLKYHLLMKELVKHTNENHSEYTELSTALEEMQDISLYVNEVKRDNENIELISEIEKSIVDLRHFLPTKVQLHQYGKRLYDGQLRMKSPENKHFVVRYIFLFEKVLLACKSQGDTYTYRDFLIIKHHNLVLEVEQSASEKPVPFVFGLQEQRLDAPKCYYFAAKSQELLLKWREAIELAIDNVSPAGCSTNEHDFRLCTFAEPTPCGICHKLLRGVFFQGYKCKKTGICAHKECISKTSASVTNVKKSRPLPPQPRPNPQVTSGSLASPQVVSAKPSTPDTKQPAAQPQVKPTGRPLSMAAKALTSYPWFAGAMGRKQAKVLLENAVDGTFIVRNSNEESGNSQAAQPEAAGDKFALSVKCSASIPVKHIRIQKTESGEYFLASGAVFSSIPELVEFYQKNSLESNFPMVRTPLLYPCKQGTNAQQAAGHESGVMGYCTAIYSFSARNPSELSFNEGDCIEILSKTSKCWWKGRLGTKVGNFPYNYVEESN